MDVILYPIFNTSPFEHLNNTAAVLLAIGLPLLAVLALMHYIIAGSMTSGRIHRFTMTLFAGAIAAAITLLMWDAVGRVPSLYRVLFTDIGVVMHGLSLALVVLITATTTLFSTKFLTRQQNTI